MSGEPDDGTTLGERDARVAEALERYSPIELARAVATDDDARSAFLSMRSGRYWVDVKTEKERIEARKRAQDLIADQERRAIAGPNAPPAGASWEPSDVTATVEAIRAGTVQRPRPSVGVLSDDGALFYAGKVNGVHGESGCGKTWTSLACVAQELAEGEHVVYIDLEDDEAGLVSRLLDMGVPAPMVAAGLRYVHPDEQFDQNAAEALMQCVREFDPSLVVIDSTGEAMALDGVQPNADEEVASWFQRLPGRIARLGPAVVVLDHMAKADNGGLWPIGSQRKRAAISGAQYLQKLEVSFDQQTPGHAKLVCAKDRHGTYRVGLTVAELHVNPTRELTVDLHGVTDAARDAGTAADAVMVGIASFLTELPNEHPGASITLLRKGVRGKSDRIDRALTQLIAEGYVSKTVKGQSQLHRLVRPYLPDFEDGGTDA